MNENLLRHALLIHIHTLMVSDQVAYGRWSLMTYQGA